MSATKVVASTPKRPAPAAAAAESPGNWTHPRLKEIARRRNATTFNDKNVRRIAQNVGAIAALFVVRLALRSVVGTDGYAAPFLLQQGCRAR